jgi:ABC-2 type transport system ATP-binding protein
MAILLSSHLLNQVQSVCDRIGIFSAGRLIGQGTMTQLAQRFGEGRQELELVLDVDDDGERSRARNVLSAVPGVAEVQAAKRASAPWVLTVAQGAELASVRSQTLAAVASERLPLVSIRAVEPSLEDIYRRAVSGTAGAHRAAAVAGHGEAAR